MDRKTLAKIAAIVILLLMIANLLLFVFIPVWLFWAIIILGAFLAYFVIPKIRK